MMMSSFAASHAEQFANDNNNKDHHNNTNSTNSKRNVDNETTNTFSPITDKKETSARQSTPHINIKLTANPATTTTTRIPYPLTTFLSNTTEQFRRSASLRLRGTKSNLFLNHTSRGDSAALEGGHQMATEPGVEGVNTPNEAQSETTLATETATMAEKTMATQEQQQRPHVTHEFLATGRISPRRKLVLNSQRNLGSGGSLTRSLSLRRNYKYSNSKTDTPQQEACHTAAAAAAAHAATADTDVAVKATAALQARAVPRDEPDGHANGSSGRTTNEILAKIDAEIGVASATEKMSLNLNGNGAARPATLSTSSNHIAASCSANSKSPKTPTTPHLHTHSHTHIHSKHCHTQTTKHSPLASVPETKLTPKTPPVTPDSPSTYLDDDLDSMYSFATTTSGRSTMSCEHPYVARNGTTFSGRKMKYVVHCSNYAGQIGPDYLTPTQRASRQIRRLKELLCVARQDLEQKDSEILRLTREVVELRLFKASLSSPEERSASSDAVTVREAELKTSQDVSPIVDMVDDAAKSSPRHIASVGAAHHQHHHHRHSSSPQNLMQLSSEMQNSFADSGHFEDLTSSSVHSKDSYAAHTHDMACGSDEAASGSGSGDNNSTDSYELQRQELIRMYEQRIEDLIRNQDTATSEMKRSHNDKVEALLQKLAECNTRYADIVPDYEHAKERIRELEKQLEDLQRKLAEHEEKQNKMYLHMYQKGQEAERIARADQALELAHRAPTNKVSINELLHQLQSTQDELENIRTIYRRLLEAQKNRTHVDPEVTLQFLKSAVYYFLTDKENSQGHLQAIESILEFTETEKRNINQARAAK